MTETPDAVSTLVGVVARLRAECPWHAELTHEALVPYLIEECYELVEVIERGTDDARHRTDVREELGDVLYQVVLHSTMAAEGPGGATDARAETARGELDAVAAGLAEKLVRRHPHVFGHAGPTTVEQLNSTWEQVKDEQGAEVRSRAILAGVPFSLPALALADKVLERASRRGRPVRVSAVAHPETEAEFGAALLALVAAAKGSGVNADRALRAAIRGVADDLAE
ncbi:hypothetical protein GCM10022198_21020 [Klugiella xanthotipulae]|uniref:XTP/dITP diphosphohydrolase n=1 Tax=Klugiella xanthotipulae TaxID=244735 RepID=A0A543HY03_9MICO|nr:MazG nucleotide pyrophosphohydrolase domain-containing protein [Klugiella xanthotipulae]TQM63189.1 XTP/dITP diphosphohydrolase [Klugiella xanthotipulae]